MQDQRTQIGLIAEIIDGHNLHSNCTAAEKNSLTGARGSLIQALLKKADPMVAFIALREVYQSMPQGKDDSLQSFVLAQRDAGLIIEQIEELSTEQKFSTVRHPRRSIG